MTTLITLALSLATPGNAQTPSPEAVAVEMQQYCLDPDHSPECQDWMTGLLTNPSAQSQAPTAPVTVDVDYDEIADRVAARLAALERTPAEVPSGPVDQQTTQPPPAPLVAPHPMSIPCGSYMGGNATVMEPGGSALGRSCWSEARITSVAVCNKTSNLWYAFEANGKLVEMWIPGGVQARLPVDKLPKWLQGTGDGTMPVIPPGACAYLELPLKGTYMVHAYAESAFGPLAYIETFGYPEQQCFDLRRNRGAVTINLTGTGRNNYPPEQYGSDYCAALRN